MIMNTLQWLVKDHRNEIRLELYLIFYLIALITTSLITMHILINYLIPLIVQMDILPYIPCSCGEIGVLT